MNNIKLVNNFMVRIGNSIPENMQYDAIINITGKNEDYKKVQSKMKFFYDNGSHLFLIREADDKLEKQNQEQVFNIAKDIIKSIYDATSSFDLVISGNNMIDILTEDSKLRTALRSELILNIKDKIK